MSQFQHRAINREILGVLRPDGTVAGACPRFPWVTTIVVLAATVPYIFPSLATAAIYDRAAILHGQLWRVLTGSDGTLDAKKRTWSTL